MQICVGYTQWYVCRGNTPHVPFHESEVYHGMVDIQWWVFLLNGTFHGSEEDLLTMVEVCITLQRHNTTLNAMVLPMVEKCNCTMIQQHNTALDVPSHGSEVDFLRLLAELRTHVASAAFITSHISWLVHLIRCSVPDISWLLHLPQ